MANVARNRDRANRAAARLGPTRQRAVAVVECRAGDDPATVEAELRRQEAAFRRQGLDPDMQMVICLADDPDDTQGADDAN